MERDFKRNLFHTILSGNYADMTKYHTGDLIVRINGDASQVYGGVLSMVSSVAGLVTSLITAMVMLNSIATGFMVVMVCGSAVIALFTLLIQRKMKQLQLQSAKASSKVTGFIQESVSKLLIVQALDVSKQMEARAENLLEEKWQVQRKRKNINILMNLGASLLAYVGSFAALLWCVTCVCCSTPSARRWRSSAKAALQWKPNSFRTTSTSAIWCVCPAAPPCAAAVRPDSMPLFYLLFLCPGQPGAGELSPSLPPPFRG
jgi:ABC-type multidrug transport system fused ATPase/permease subunit